MSTFSVATLGVPRIGPRRELKFALEKYWAGEISLGDLNAAAANLRAAAWSRQHAASVDILPSNDFSFYDHVLDTAVMAGAVPSFYGWRGGKVPLDIYFAMARGTGGRKSGDLPALEMTKWFDTNYHYMVPEFERGQTFSLSSAKAVDEFREATKLGHATRPVLLGPVTFLLLGKSKDETQDPLSLLPGLLPVYVEVLKRLASEGATWVQIDEPCLATDLRDTARQALRQAYDEISKSVPQIRVMLTTYFGELGNNIDTVARLPVAGLHLDLVRGHQQIGAVMRKAPKDWTLSLGVIDGRNVWRADLEKILVRVQAMAKAWPPERLQLAPSCSLMHVPVDLTLETDVPDDIRSWLSFAAQKMDELVILKTALNQGAAAVADRLAASTTAAQARAASPKVSNPRVTAKMSAVTPDMAKRNRPFAQRRKLQQDILQLPPYPTTTIGSFPQTAAVRDARASRARGSMSDADYGAFLRRETEACIRWQEAAGLDVLVHGEFERNDMVQYFGEQLSGFAFTKHGWVQSYGSRYVRPPIIFGDVSRPAPMTVDWAVYAQSLTQKPMKGMLTGPVTILQWSFVRDDLPRSAVCRQIALALREEAADLETAGIKIIQIDEPALREGLPLRMADRQTYLEWAIEAFRLASSGVSDDTQIHTHMCYAEFNDIIAAIGALDADVISIETARSKMELLKAFSAYRYPNEIGPGVYDIHSPRCPSVEEIVELLQKASAMLSPEQIWINPDCGLKTRKWDEVKPAIANLVAAARRLRRETKTS